MEDSPYEDECEFYEQLEKVLSPTIGRRIPIVLGIGANGVVGSVVSESVGAVNASTESLNGMMLRSMCQAYNLKLVNTFMDGAPTWASSADNGRRIDFIAVSRSHFEKVTGCWLDRSIDWVLAVRPKDSVRNPFSGDSGVNSVLSPVSLQRIDPISLRDPAARASFRELLRKLLVESRGDPYQVTEMWRRGFESAALQCFKRKVPAKKVRKTWISECTLLQMQQVGSIRRARENMHVRWKRAVGGLAFYA